MSLFENCTGSVVNVVDATLGSNPVMRVAGAVDVPEGNGSGVVWDNEGHIVTNYHVLAGVLGVVERGAMRVDQVRTP